MNKLKTKEGQRDYAQRLLNLRYEKCDREGHKLPNKKTELCDYCDRYLMQTRQQKVSDKTRGIAKIIEELETFKGLI